MPLPLPLPLPLLRRRPPRSLHRGRWRCRFLRAHFIQIAILQMHQNGRDTHIRQIKVYGPREGPSRALLEPEFETLEMTMFSTIR